MNVECVVMTSGDACPTKYFSCPLLINFNTISQIFRHYLHVIQITKQEVLVMAQATRTFRIFVSSTFEDLKEERNALQERVFPKLRELCMQYGCRFQAIDLRWGVSEEASLDQQAVRICLEEIKRRRKVTPRPNRYSKHLVFLYFLHLPWCSV